MGSTKLIGLVLLVVGIALLFSGINPPNQWETRSLKRLPAVLRMKPCAT